MNALAPIPTVCGAGVYFVQDGLGRVKIGVTNDVAKRLSSLKTGSSTDLSLIRFIEGAGPKVEKWLHRRFKDQRIQGEWFEFSAAMMQIITPDETASIPQIVKRRDIRLTTKERIAEAIRDADMMGLSPKQTLTIVVQNLDDAEAEVALNAIQKNISGAGK